MHDFYRRGGGRGRGGVVDRKEPQSGAPSVAYQYLCTEVLTVSEGRRGAQPLLRRFSDAGKTSSPRVHAAGVRWQTPAGPGGSIRATRPPMSRRRTQRRNRLRQTIDGILHLVARLLILRIIKRPHGGRSLDSRGHLRGSPLAIPLHPIRVRAHYIATDVTHADF